jgi:hypothetical protein
LGGGNVRDRTRIVFVLAALTVLALGARAASPVKLEGEYQISGPLDHSGSTTHGSSHLYVSLTGEAARTLYTSLGGDPIDDACTGYKLKGRSNVVCYEISPNERYSCSFSINLERGAVEAGLGGCF